MDPEKDIPSGTASDSLVAYEQGLGKWQNFKDSFKPATEYEKLNEKTYDNEDLTELQRINIQTASSPLQRKLKNRHIQMIAIASSIGLGLLIGTGSALHTGGPAALLISWSITGVAILCTIQAMAELAVTFPISGSFNVYASKFIDPSVGFAVAWNYFLQFLVLMPLEIVAGSITIRYWNTSINPDVWVAIIYIVIISINFFGVRAYGEAEFIFSTIKVIAIIGFIILSIVLAAGGGAHNPRNGAKFWHDPGPFANGFKGVVSTLIVLAFSYAGIELCGICAGEAASPRVAIPRASKQAFWRILVFYMLSLTLITFLVSYENPQLMGASSYDVTASPFVIAIKESSISGLPSVMNAVILISVISVGSSSVYATSRTLTSLAEQGLAPKICGYVDRAGRPLVAIMITNVFGLISFIAATDKQDEIFTWLLAISALSSLFTWLSICVAHIRFRAALKFQGRDTNELAYKSQTGVIGSYLGAIIHTIVIIAQFWLSLFPLGESPNAKGFFAGYLGFVILIVFYVGHKIWRKNWILFIKVQDMDIDSGRRETDIEALKEELAEEREILKSKPFYYRAYHFWC